MQERTPPAVQMGQLLEQPPIRGSHALRVPSDWITLYSQKQWANCDTLMLREATNMLPVRSYCVAVVTRNPAYWRSPWGDTSLHYPPFAFFSIQLAMIILKAQSQKLAMYFCVTNNQFIYNTHPSHYRVDTIFQTLIIRTFWFKQTKIFTGLLRFQCTKGVMNHSSRSA